MTPTVYYNGRLVPESEAHVGVDDGGWLHGAGLFETMRAESERVFRLDDHLSRLRRSAEVLLHVLHPEILPTGDDLSGLIRANGLRSARLRLTVSAGSMRGGDSTETPRLNVCVSVSPLAQPPPEVYARGVQVKLCSFRTSPSDPLAGHKCTSYLGRLLGLREAQRAQCFEALWFTTLNHLAEGSISNVFLVRDGALLTPPLSTPVLPGIARDTTLTLARALGIEAREQVLSIDDLLEAEEVFLTNIVFQVLPVVRIERRDIGEGAVGSMSKRLLNAFTDYVLRECGLS